MSSSCFRTKLIYWGSRLFCSPLDAFFTLLIFIISKETNASGLQLTILASTKPVVSLVAFYMNTLLIGQTQRIKNYLIVLNLMASLPVIFFPFIDNVWFYVVSYILFMISLRATYPAWTEILKSAIGTDKMGKVVSTGLSIQYSLTIFIPIAMSFWMDQDPKIWRMLFSAMGVFQLCYIVPLLLLKVAPSQEETYTADSIKEVIVAPWRSGWELCKEKTDFTKFLILYFLGGIGIVAIMPVLPTYFKENLNLSYTELTLAISLCKGIGFVMTSSFWAHLLPKQSIFAINAYVNALACFFFVLLFAASFSSYWVLAAYFIYGIMQSGCDLIFNMSGPIFSKKMESVKYSGVNLAFIGVRGLIFPFIGQILYANTDVSTVLILSTLISFMCIFYGLSLDRKYRQQLCKE